MAARLAREHGGGERSWQRAMTEARTQYEHGQDQDDEDVAMTIKVILHASSSSEFRQLPEKSRIAADRDRTA
ncbi:hypothetical protein GCM10010377_77450 [Streptomyces viridiviolaceus]|uniref:Uncharacterized protein n=1 Tax=Streptomyces viridiviolaceus TaxID=68282 RepID=A0ABW2E115_9ACTN|nr:hypothetical protein [Streptomyces viridiviolaceus]GHB75576.1 hypothetical protein GCM10010377_77450 [Streptomyces viridiviolaceus]